MDLLHVNVFEHYLDEVLEHYHGVGTAIRAFDKQGTILYENFRGYRDAESKAPLDENTMFGIASVSKSFTCLAIMQLAEQGILDIYAPVRDYLPEFQPAEELGTVRIFHLMSHVAGFFPLPRTTVSQVAESMGLTEADGDLAYHTALAEQGAAKVIQLLNEQTRFTGKPGQHTSYSNDSFAVLTHLVHRYGGKPSFAQYIEQAILAPLGMTRSNCNFQTPQTADNVATLYQDVDGVQTGSHDFHDNAFVLMGGGGVKSTLSDLQKYVTMYLQKGKNGAGNSLVSEASVDAMCYPKAPFSAGEYYGYGLYSRKMEDFTIVGHGGSLPGVSSQIAWSEELGIGVVVLCNTSNVPVSLLSNALMRLCAGYYPLPNRDVYRACSWSKERLQGLCGSYSSGEGTDFQLAVEEDTLYMVTEDSKNKVVPVQENLAIIPRKYSDGILIPYEKEGTVYAVANGSRMVPKVQ